ncbi:MAG: phage Gp37/Gp68 family protein [Pseudomonadota bacterium]
MAQHTTIEWTEATWNPVTGCSRMSLGCRNCYAERMAHRLKAMRNPRYRNGFMVTLQPDTLDIPLRWKKPRMIFVNSMSDLFHKDVPFSYIKEVFSVIEESGCHTFQVLTKRANRLRKLAEKLSWPPNLWMGVTVETVDYQWRIKALEKVPAVIRFISFEPLLGPLPQIPLNAIDWVIVGGESGPGARTMRAEWVRDLKDQCRREHVPFFFKQWSGARKQKGLPRLDGRTWTNYPRTEHCRG